MFVLHSTFRFGVLLALLLLILHLLFTPLQRNSTTLRFLADLSNSPHYLFPVTNNTPYLMGMVSLKRGDSATAERFFQAALQTRHHILAAVALIHLWQTEDAWEHVLTLVETLQPINAEIVNQIPVEQLPAAELSELLDVLKKRTPHLLLNLAFRLLVVQRFSEAAHWAMAITDEQQQLEAQRIVGMSLFYQNRFVDAQKIFAVLYKQTDGKNADLNYWFGRSLQYTGYAKLAIEPLGQAVALEKNPWYLYELGRAYITTGRCQDAQQVLTLASQINTDQQLAVALQGMVTILINC